MNVVNLPTNIFTVSNSFADCYNFAAGAFTTSAAPIGTSDYTVLMWSNSMTAFKGDGIGANIPTTVKLGGMVMFSLNESSLEDPVISRNTFQNPRISFSMNDVYGSDMSKFSAGGYVWASEAQFNIL